MPIFDKHSDPFGYLTFMGIAYRVVVEFNHGDWRRAETEVIAFLDGLDTNGVYDVRLRSENPPHLTDCHCEIVVSASEQSIIDDLIKFYRS